VHAPMAAVLPGMTRLDAFDLDPKTEPPHAQLREIEQGVGTGKGYVVVGAGARRQAALVDQALCRPSVWPADEHVVESCRLLAVSTGQHSQLCERG
jgi:hypothetical protein